jgi:hypothetical protein
MVSFMHKATTALFIIITFLVSLTGGACADVHAESHGLPVTGSVCESGTHAASQSSPCAPDHDSHPDDGHCDDCCGCTCFRSTVADGIVVNYSPTVSTLSRVEPFLVFPDVFLPKFVPPERLS